MGTGYIPTDTLCRLMEEAEGVPGDFAEVGAFKGVTTRRMIPEAVRQGKLVRVFDSFAGLAPPGPHDSGYASNFDVGGVDKFVALMEANPSEAAGYLVHPGWIPDCFALAGHVYPISFCYLDVDRYQPTLDALRWVWPRLAKGANLVLDDVCTVEARVGKALAEFLAIVQGDKWTQCDIGNDQRVIGIGGYNGSC